ncbi:MAG TPA: hypothetical protein VFZ01_01040 [Geminicoccaceae bacterium]
MTAQPAHAPPSGGDLEAAVQAFPFWYRRIRLPGGVVTPGCAPLDGMVDAVDGLFEGEIGSLSQQNTAAQYGSTGWKSVSSASVSGCSSGSPRWRRR